jgi:hypothetical protein
MSIEFNKNQFFCNLILPQDANIQDAEITESTIKLSEEVTIDKEDNPGLYQNCVLMKEFDEKRKSELGYVDATNIQQRTWFQMTNLVIGCAIMLYAINKLR